MLTVIRRLKATKKLQSMNLDFPWTEFQFAAAVSAESAEKAPGSVFPQGEHLIFPDINAGNIDIKSRRGLRLRGVRSLLQANAPINDLSRGCNAEEVYKMAIRRPPTISRELASKKSRNTNV
jgi:phosphate acetyltransferase